MTARRPERRIEANVKSDAPTRYVLVVRGELEGRFSAFDGMSLSRGGGQTTLEGEVADQAALQGLIDRIGDFGLELISVNRVG